MYFIAGERYVVWHQSIRAAFALGRAFEGDNPEVRSALLKCAMDADEGLRAEGLYGLCGCKAPEALGLMRFEIEYGHLSWVHIEAAGLLRHAGLIPSLLLNAKLFGVTDKNVAALSDIVEAHLA